MHIGKYRIADVVIQIESLYPGIHRMCQGYICQENMPAQITVRIQPEDIAFEKHKSEQEALAEGKLPNDLHEGYLETLAVYRKLAEAMLAGQDTLLFHGSAIAAEGKAVLFTAKSGTGKSTHTRLWREMLGDGCFMVNDDKPLLRIRDTDTKVCGTPWNGKHRLGTNCMVPLAAICILRQGQTNEITQISFTEALPELLQQSYRPADRQKLPLLLKLLGTMAANVRFYRLSCNMEPDAAKLAYETILGSQAR